MKIDRKQQKEITLSILNMIVPNFTKLNKEEQKNLYGNMHKGVHKFILKEYHRYNSLKDKVVTDLP